MFKTRGGSTDRRIGFIKERALMAKVANASEYHRHVALVCSGNHLFVTN
jgi:hypothetical protein